MNKRRYDGDSLVRGAMARAPADALASGLVGRFAPARAPVRPSRPPPEMERPEDVAAAISFSRAVEYAQELAERDRMVRSSLFDPADLPD